MACLLDQLSLPRFGLVFPLCSDEAVCNVAENSVVEEEGLLLDQADLRPPPFEIEIFQVVATNRDGSGQLGFRWLLVHLAALLVMTCRLWRFGLDDLRQSVLLSQRIPAL